MVRYPSSESGCPDDSTPRQIIETLYPSARFLLFVGSALGPQLDMIFPRKNILIFHSL
jgi:hypothetical protein